MMRFGWFKVLCLVVLIVLASNIFVRSQSQAQVESKSEIPISYGLVVDNSGSVRSLLDYIVEACKVIVSDNQSNDETFLVRFIDSKNIERVSAFTQDKAAIINAAENFYCQSGQTAVIDALYESAQYLAQNSKSGGVNRRRTLILISDGEERESRQKLDKLLELLREKKIQVYVIGITAQLEKDKGKKSSKKAVSFLTQLANETGGQAFFPKNVPELKSNAIEMLNKIRNQ